MDDGELREMEAWEAEEATKPDCPRCDGLGWSRWERIMEALWYDFCHHEALHLLRTSPDPIPAVLADFARTIIASGQGWGEQLDQGDIDALVAEGRLWDWTRVPRTPAQRAAHARHRAAGGGYWLAEPNGYHPTAEEVNARQRAHAYHDALNRWICAKHRLARWDMGDTCGDCRGTGKVGGIPWREVVADADAA
jgi:hypothetical protein